MTVGSDTQGFTIGTPGPLPPVWASAPMDVQVEESGALAAVAVVRFHDPDRALLKQTGITIGAPFTIEVQIGAGSPAKPLFTGEVVSLEAEFDGSGSFTTVRALDVSHRLQRGRRIVGYPSSTASEIVEQVVKAAGLTKVQIDPTTTVYGYVTQPNVSDWDFLRTLALENEREMVVEDGTFYFRKPVPAAAAPALSAEPEKSPYVLELGKNVLAVRAMATSVNQVTTVEVRGWDVAAKKAVSANPTVQPSPEQQLTLTPAKVTAPFAPANLLVADVPYRTDAEVTAVATALAAENAAGMAELELTVRGTPELRVGVPVTLSSAGDPFDGKYTITAASHTDLRGIGYETRITVSGQQDRTLPGLAAAASAAARSARIPSVAVGVVVDIMRPGQKTVVNGYDTQPEQGWVKLKFPWLSDSPSLGDPAYVTDWVRTVQLGGVAGGSLFCPDIDDEVLVAFEQGLLDRPVVLGGLYNGKDTPSPVAGQLLSGNKVRRRVLSSRDGDRLELLGPSGKGEGVQISTGKDELTVHLDRTNTKIMVNSRGEVAITAARDITISATGGALKLSGASVSIRGDSEVSVNAPLIKLN
ncbi:phage protein D/phage baseplate assembly protein gpV [Kitasatospora sp. MAP12-15]|uniref:VgrG-related protein n=1 Tax=unclassified Kitasatospora TaxID=2633591 RepID=UPI002476E21C|nr:VgrG-related protein [Kitasatospora sp. MAP12-44]MDH6113644.1 phage protein D/phage baseplate assembly protein gpV [Kitasatospora sp. MAP12-44]